MDENEIRVHLMYRRQIVLIDKKGVKYILNPLQAGGFQVYTKRAKHEVFAGSIDGIVRGKSFFMGLYKDVKNPETIKTLESKEALWK